MSLSPENIEMFKLVVQPIADRLDRMEPKLDHISEIGERVRAVESVSDRSEASVKDLYSQVADTKLQLARTNGRNEIITWLLTLVGAPIVVGLALAGIAAWFTHSGPGAISQPPHAVPSMSASVPEPLRAFPS